MITIEREHSLETGCKGSAMCFIATTALFPTLSLAHSEMLQKHLAEEIVRIEGTVTVSF
jgi:hypothetical protein